MIEYKDKMFYRLVKPLLNFLVWFLFHPEVVGKENIPKKGPVVLAGNHTKWLDPVALCAINHRQVHFLAKKELFSSKASFIVRGMGAIPVDRKIHDKNALESAISALKHNLVIGVFPEGTINRTEDVIMPFKIGAVKMSLDSHATLVPFVITGKYRLFRRGIRFEFMKPIEVLEDLDKSNEELMMVVKNGLIEGGVRDGKKR